MGVGLGAGYSNSTGKFAPINVSKDVDAVRMDTPCRVRVGELVDAGKIVEAADQPGPKIAAILAAEAIAEDLETRTVMTADATLPRAHEETLRPAPRALRL